MPRKPPPPAARFGLVACAGAAVVLAVVAWRLLAEPSPADEGPSAAAPAAASAGAVPAPGDATPPAEPASPAAAPGVVPAPAARPAAPPGTGAALWGTVVNARGVPVPGASLWFHPRRDELARREGRQPAPLPEDADAFERTWSTLAVAVQADGRGDYDSGVLDAGTWLVAAMVPGELLAPVQREVTLADGDERELRLELATPSVLAGRVRDARGGAASGALVRVEEVGVAPGVCRSFELRADASGGFTQRVAPGAPLRVSASSYDGREAASVLLPPGSTDVTLTWGQVAGG